MELIRPIQYAQKHGFSKVWVYKLILKKKVKTKVIAGVTFIIDEKD